MKSMIRYSLSIILMGTALFTSCDNEIDNVIPSDAPRLEHYINKLQDFMIASAKNGEVWISDAQFETESYHPLTFSNYKAPFFWAIQLKDKKNSNIFVSTRHEKQTSSSNEFVADNPVKYKLDGFAKIDLTFLNFGILSELRAVGLLDLEYKVSSYNKDSIVLYSYSLLENVTMKPYKFDDDLKEFFKSSRQIKTYEMEGLLFSDNFGDTGIKISRGADILYSSKKGENTELKTFDKRLSQYLDKENKLFVYKFIEGLDLPLFTNLGIALLKPIESDIANRKIVFMGYNNDNVKLEDAYRVEVNYDREDWGDFDF